MKNFLIVISIFFSIIALEARSDETSEACLEETVLSPQFVQITRSLSPQCFNERPNSTQIEMMSQDEALTSEKKLCGCLSKSPLLKSFLEQKPTKDETAVSGSAYDMDFIPIEQINDHIEKIRDRQMFQAISLNGGEDDPEFLGIYSMNRLNDNTKNVVSDANRLIKEKRQDLLNPPLVQAPKEMDKSLYVGEPECFALRDYVSFNETPRFYGLFKFFADTPTFKRADWTVDGLKAAGKDDLTIAQNMFYLESNPLYGTLFSIANPSKAVADQQEKLFQILRRDFGETFKKCKDALEAGACQKMHLESGIQHRSKAAIKEIFRHPDVMKEVNKATDDQINKVMAADIKEVLNPRRIDMVGLAADMSHNECTDIIASNTSSEKYERCMAALIPYCGVVKRMEDRSAPFDPEKMSQMMINKMRKDSGDKHPDFTNAKTRVCGDRNDGKTPATIMNFAAYQHLKCSRTISSDVCGQGKRKKLLSQFLTDFPNSGTEENSDGEKIFSSNLASYLKDDKETGISEKAYQVVRTTGRTSEEFNRGLASYSKSYVARTPSIQSTEQSAPQVHQPQKLSPVPRAMASGAESVIAPTVFPNVPAFVKPTTTFPAAQAAVRAPQAEIERPIKPKAAAEVAAVVPTSEPKRNESIKALESELADLEERLSKSNKVSRNEIATPALDRSPAANAAGQTPQPIASSTASNFTQQQAPAAQTSQSPSAAQGQRSFAMNLTESGSLDTEEGSSKFKRGLYDVKYQIDKESKSGALIVAQELLLSKIDPLVMSEANRNETVPVSVSKEDFEKIANRDLETLSTLAKRLQSISGEVLKINVSSMIPGVEPLQLLFLKKEGQMLYQPIRTHTFQRLREITTQQ